jgi:hypothetical protein
MATVVYLKAQQLARHKATLDSIDIALGREFVRLAKLHGPQAVTTVALTYVTSAIRQTRRKGRPVELKWLADLKRQFDAAMEGKQGDESL